jgi:energy-coupling factor transport system ATP-binding protein
VWLPVSTLAALRLREAGVQIDPLPITPAELGAALDAAASLPAPRDPAAALPAAGASAAAAVVSARGVSVRRGGKRGPLVVHEVDLEVPAGDFLAVVGVNGAGKSSLLQALAGVIAPAAGRIEAAGIDPTTADAATRSRAIGYVFQNPEHQFVAGTVAGELEQALGLQGVPEAERAASVASMLERFGLAEAATRHPFLLSGGQKRRLSVGTALIAGAPLLVLDEPTFGQDRERAGELVALLRELNDAGTTVIAATHDLQLVADHASRVAVMAEGRLVGVGPTAEVLAGPLIEQAGLRHPPLARATRGLANHPEWRAVTRWSQLPAPGGTA